MRRRAMHVGLPTHVGRAVRCALNSLIKPDEAIGMREIGVVRVWLSENVMSRFLRSIPPTIIAPAGSVCRLSRSIRKRRRIDIAWRS